MRQTAVTQIGNYKILGIIGKGGMGVVYRATDPAIGRTVAIKMLKGDYAEDSDLLSRFYQEAKSTGRLHHPNIVTVFAAGDQDGQPYIVLEYLDGQALNEIIATQRIMPLFEKMSLMTQVCDGLQYAHEHQVVHRDIKPANVIVLPNGTAKIVDFGIARIGQGKGLTMTGQMVGSLSYMSPEQINGSPLDARTDLFSTGVMIFEFLTGHVPFEGKEPFAVFNKIVNDPTPPLSKFLSEYPADLDEIIARATAKKVTDRYQSAEELGLDLARVQDRLKRELISQLLLTVEVDLQRSHLERARSRLQEILKLDRQHMRANELLREVRQTLQKQERSAQLLHLQSQAEVAFAGLRYEEALTSIEQAISLDAGNRVFLALKEAVRSAQARAARAKQLLEQGETALYAGSLEQAEAAIRQALEIDPQNVEARALAGIVEKELAERVRRRKVQDLVDVARHNISSHHFSTALNTLEQAQELAPGDSNVKELIRWAKTGQEQEQKRREIEQHGREIDEALRQQHYSLALELAENALQKHPGEPNLLKLKSLSERQREIWRVRQFVEDQTMGARELVQAGRHEQAIELLTAALQRCPGEPNLLAAISVIRAELQTRHAQESAARAREAQLHQERIRAEEERLRVQQRRQAEEAAKALLAEMMWGIEDALQQHQYSIALAMVEEALLKYPNEQKLLQLKSTAQEQEQIFTIRQFVQEQTAAGRELAEIGRHEHAIELLSAALQRYPAEPTLVATLSTIRAQMERRLAKEAAARAREEQLRQERVRAEEEKRRIEEERRKTEEVAAAKAREEQLRQERVRAEEEKRRIEEERRKAAELAAAKAREEQLRQERVRAEEEKRRVEEERRKAAELAAAKVREEQLRQERVRAEEEKRRVEEERRKAEEVAAAKTREEQLRQERLRAEEEKRRAEEASMEGLLRDGFGSPAENPPAKNPVVPRDNLGDGTIEPVESSATVLLSSSPVLPSPTHDTPEPIAPAERVGSKRRGRKSEAPEKKAAKASTPSPVAQPFAQHHSTPVAATATTAVGKRVPLWVFFLTGVLALAVVGAILWPKSVTVHLETDPPGGKVSLNGESCVAPCDLKLRPGTYRFHVVRDGYVSMDQQIVVTSHASPARFAMTAVPPPPLKPGVARGTLTVHTNVEGARVLVDLTPRGVTRPDGTLQVIIEEGKHEVRVAKDRFREVASKSVEIHNNRESRVDFKLESEPGPVLAVVDSFITVKAEPGAAVSIDHKASVLVPSDGLVSVKVAPSNHQIDVTKDGYKPWSRSAVVNSGDNVSVVAMLEKIAPPPPPPPNPPKPATMTVRVSVPGAEVRIDSRTVGSTGNDGNYSSEITAGEHRIEIVKEGYQKWSTDRSFSAGDRVDLPVPLAKILPNPPNNGGLTDSDMITGTLGQLEQAYSTKNTDEICRIWPSCPRKKIEDAFKDAISVSMKYLPSSPPKITGELAVVPCTRIRDTLLKGNGHSPGTDKVTIHLRKQGNAWRIESIE